jgi:hypothetical protein
MPVRRAPLLLISAAAAAALALPAQAPAASKRCNAKAGTTLSSKSDTVRTFTRTAGKVSDAKGQRLRLYACQGDAGTTVRLDQITSKKTSRFTARRALSAGTGSNLVWVSFDHATGGSSTAWMCLYDRAKGREIYNAKLAGTVAKKRIAVTASGGLALVNGGVLIVLDATGSRTIETAGVKTVKATGDTVTYTVAGVAKTVALTGHPAWVQGD